MSHSKLPNFFIVGAPKCGTTALSRYLGEHPEVFFASPKEPHYFCFDFPTRRQVADWNQYCQLFSSAQGSHKAIGEASVHYLRSEVAIPELFQHFPQARLIVMLRDPLQFLPSYHGQMLFSLTETISNFSQAWERSKETFDRPGVAEFTREPTLLDYCRAAKFGNQVERLLSVVPRSQVLFLEFERLKQNPQLVYRTALDFLQLTDDGRTEFPVVNAGHQARLTWLSAVLRKTQRLSSRWEVKKWFKPASIVGRAIWQLNQKSYQRDQLPGELIAELCDVFRADCRLLSELTGLETKHWLTQAEETALQLSDQKP